MASVYSSLVQTFPSSVASVLTLQESWKLAFSPQTEAESLLSTPSEVTRCRHPPEAASRSLGTPQPPPGLEVNTKLGQPLLLLVSDSLSWDNCRNTNRKD